MKKRITIGIIICIIMMSLVPASIGAAVTESVRDLSASYSSATGMMNIQGIAVSGAGIQVLIRVKSPNGILAFFGQVESVTGGAFSQVFKLNCPDDGNYSVDAIAEGRAVTTNVAVSHETVSPSPSPAASPQVSPAPVVITPVSSPTPSPSPSAEPKVEFKDTQKHWAKSAIDEMVSRQIMSGTGGNTFEPDKTITRAEFASVVVKALGLKTKGNTNSFTDMKSSSLYFEEVGIAHEYGLINGYGKNTFKPESKITREESMAILYKAMMMTDLKDKVKDSADNLAKFKDNKKIAAWAKKSAAACIDMGIFSGNSNVLAPKDNITRAQTATVFVRLLQKAGLM